MPFTRALDTTNATSSSSDPACGGGGPTVWFSYSPTKTTTVGVTTEGSHYYTTIAFGTRTGSGGFRLEDCRYGSLRFEAKAGTTYLFVVADEEYEKGGILVFSLASVPPAPEISLSIDPEGSFDAQGRALITGTVSCSSRVDDLEPPTSRFARGTTASSSRAGAK